MSKTYYKYQVKCSTEGAMKYWILEDTASVPTTCPTNTAHTIDSTYTNIVNVISDNVVTVREESIETDGHFFTETVRIDATKNTTTTITKSWPYDVSVLAVEFISETTHFDDKLDIYVGEDTIIGYITANVAPASAWVSQNYTVGQTVTYTHPTFGSRVYTCILNTVSNDLPTNKTYWRHGLEISVSSTVTDNIVNGAYIKLYNGVNQDSVNRVIHHDNSNMKIYVETNVTNSFASVSPTYVQMTVYMVKDYKFGPAGRREIGNSKIGGAHIPADTLIKATYTNYSTTDDKVFIGQVEFLQ